MGNSIKMRHIWYDYVKTNIDLYFAAGLSGIAPPWFDAKPNWYRLVWYVYQNVTDLILYFITVANFVGAIFLTETFDVFASLPPLIHGIQMSGRLVIFQSTRADTNEYLKELDALLEEDLRNPIEQGKTFREMYESDFMMNRNLTILEFFSLMVSNIVFFVPECVKSFVRPEEAHVIIVSWYPYDSNFTSNKQITNVVHTFSWLLINFKMASFDTLFQSLIILHTSLFRQLRYLFGEVITSERSGIDALDDKENGELACKLRWWIEQHQRTLSVTKKLENVCKPLLLFSYAECLVNMCLCVFLTTVESPWTLLQRFAAVFVVGTVFVQMFVMCRLGDYLKESSIHVPDLGYNSTVFRCKVSIQKSIAMILNRTYLPVRFSAMNLFYLDSKYYGLLVQGVFSYYMALRQLQSRG